MTSQISQWFGIDSDATFSDPAQCVARSKRFARKIRLRNAAEYIAGGLVVLLSGISAIGAIGFGEGYFALAFALIAAGGIYVLHQLRLKASGIPFEPENSCVEHLRAQYRRQRDALKAVPRWYIVPWLPGILTLFGLVTTEIAGVRGWYAALGALIIPASIVLVTLAAVAWANLRAADSLQRKIEHLDEILRAE